MTGGKAERRECAFAGAYDRYKAENGVGEVTTGSLNRRCGLMERLLRLAAVPVALRTCARCPVPALVEAVRAVATLDEPDFPVGYDWMFELVHAALAAIREAK